jgi:hypothetical protein
MTMRRQMLLTGLGAIDLLLVLASLAVALALGGEMPLTGLLERSLSLGEFLLLALYLLYWHVTLATAGLYGSYLLATASRELRDVAFAAALASAPVPLLGSLLGYQRIGMAFAVTLWAVSVAGRHRPPPAARDRRSRPPLGRNLREVVVVGEGAAAHGAADDLMARGDLGYRVVEVIDAAGSAIRCRRARAALVSLEALLDRQPIDEVFLAFPLDRAQAVIAKMVSLARSRAFWCA